MLEHVEEEGRRSSTGMFGNKTKKKKNPQQKVRQDTRGPMIFCVRGRKPVLYVVVLAAMAPAAAADGAIVRRDHIGQLPGFLN